MPITKYLKTYQVNFSFRYTKKMRLFLDWTKRIVFHDLESILQVLKTIRDKIVILFLKEGGAWKVPSYILWLWWCHQGIVLVPEVLYLIIQQIPLRKTFTLSTSNKLSNDPQCVPFSWTQLSYRILYHFKCYCLIMKFNFNFNFHEKIEL